MVLWLRKDHQACARKPPKVPLCTSSDRDRLVCGPECRNSVSFGSVKLLPGMLMQPASSGFALGTGSVGMTSSRGEHLNFVRPWHAAGIFQDTFCSTCALTNTALVRGLLQKKLSCVGDAAGTGRPSRLTAAEVTSFLCRSGRIWSWGPCASSCSTPPGLPAQTASMLHGRHVKHHHVSFYVICDDLVLYLTVMVSSLRE